jgi:glycosyltransferase involved in cell wall biosynthesis
MQKDLSIVIPVYNSEAIILLTLQEIEDALHSLNISYEIILINDGSSDQSWDIIRKASFEKQGIKAINLLKNYGQHTALICGIAQAKCKYILTMDDDLQNPPSEIEKLWKKVNEGYDCVFATFAQKKHSMYRNLGSLFINWLNEKIFNKPKNLKVSNFKIFTSEVAQRITEHKTNFPYLNGLLLLYSHKMSNVETLHHPRKIGKSNYSLFKIITLVARILFNYSSYPLQWLTKVGFSIAFLSFLMGAFYFGKAMFIGSSVKGWPTLAIMLSFFNGFIIIMLGVLGEYVSRMMQQSSVSKPYIIKEIEGR